ncbi:MAG: stage II sporulation protein M [Anaerolineae bacterium]|nr:stage II sporulation protein M [Anaerolineae bacterium]
MQLLRNLINGITNESVAQRIGWMVAAFFGILIPVLIASYALLPEGILRGKHPFISQLELAPTLLTSTLQIFGYNLVPITLIVAANLIAQKSKIVPEKFVPLGYSAFWMITLIFALYTGTWSFEVVTAAPPLHERLLRMFNLTQRSGLLELSAYLLAAAASFKATLWFSDGKQIVRSLKPRELHLTRAEIGVLIFAIVLLFCAALIESRSILQLSQ